MPSWPLVSDEKLELWAYQTVKKIHDAFSRFDTKYAFDRQTDGTRGCIRAGPSFQLGTMSSRIDRRLVFPTRWFSAAAAAENQRVGKTRRRST